MNDLLLRNVRPMAAATCDILIKDGRIAAFGQFSQNLAHLWKMAAMRSLFQA